MAIRIQNITLSLTPLKCLATNGLTVILLFLFSVIVFYLKKITQIVLWIIQEQTYKWQFEKMLLNFDMIKKLKKTK